MHPYHAIEFYISYALILLQNRFSENVTQYWSERNLHMRPLCCQMQGMRWKRVKHFIHSGLMLLQIIFSFDFYTSAYSYCDPICNMSQLIIKLALLIVVLHCEYQMCIYRKQASVYFIIWFVMSQFPGANHQSFVQKQWWR